MGSDPLTRSVVVVSTAADVDLAADLSPGIDAECTFAYVRPSRMASTRAANSPAEMPWPPGPITSAALKVSETSPCCGHGGVRAATAGGATAVASQSQTEIPPLANFCAKWMCACATPDSRPEYASV